MVRSECTLAPHFADIYQAKANCLERRHAFVRLVLHDVPLGSRHRFAGMEDIRPRDHAFANHLCAVFAAPFFKVSRQPSAGKFEDWLHGVGAGGHAVCGVVLHHKIIRRVLAEDRIGRLPALDDHHIGAVRVKAESKSVLADSFREV